MARQIVGKLPGQTCVYIYINIVFGLFPILFSYYYIAVFHLFRLA